MYVHTSYIYCKHCTPVLVYACCRERGGGGDRERERERERKRERGREGGREGERESERERERKRREERKNDIKKGYTYILVSV